MPSSLSKFGAWGERIAQQWLEQRGYNLISKNYRTRFGEVDLIMRHGDAVVFIEVKTRRGEEVERALWSVGPQKQKRMMMAAQDFCAKRGLGEPEVRLELVAVLAQEGSVRITKYNLAS